MGVEEIPLEELVGIRDFQLKEGVVPEEMIIREEGEVMMILTPVESTDSSVPRKRKQKGPKYVYVLQGPPGPKGQEGQPGQAGRDGRDGQDLSLTKVLEETLKAHKPIWIQQGWKTLLTSLVEPSLKY